MTANHVVTIVGPSSYTSGALFWKGAAAILKKKLTVRITRQASQGITPCVTLSDDETDTKLQIASRLVNLCLRRLDLNLI